MIVCPSDFLIVRQSVTEIATPILDLSLATKQNYFNHYKTLSAVRSEVLGQYIRVVSSLSAQIS